MKTARYKSRKAIAAAMLVLWCFISAAAIRSQLHHWLHPDSSSPKHECAITNITNGSLLVGCSSIAVTVPSPAIAYLTGCATHHFFAFDYQVSSSRAPPSASFPITVVG
jgi:hypothetical protein